MLWFFIWIVLSTFILSVFAWSVQILLKQKKAWKAYAAKMNLSYTGGAKFMSSPTVTGKIKNYPVSLFTSQQAAADIRGQRFSTIIEIALGSGMPDNGVAGTAAMAELINGLNMPHAFVPTDKNWDPTWLIRTRSLSMMERYMTQARIDALKRIFKMNILSALFIFDQQEGVFRIETADALSDGEKLEKIMSGLIQQIDILAVNRAEYDAIAAAIGDANAPVLPPEEKEPTE